MSKLKGFCLALMAIFMLGAVASSPALAVELPEFSAETGFTGESSMTTFETVGKTAIKCKSSTSEGTASSKRSGTFHLAERECTGPLGVKCNSTGDASGVILFTGEWSLVPGEGSMLLLSPREVEVSCSGVTIRIKGTVLSMISPVEEKTKEYEPEFNETEGFQELPEYENNEGKTINTGLLASISGGAFEEIGVKVEKDRLKTTREVEIQRAPVFSVTNPLGRRALTGTSVDWLIMSLRARITPNAIAFTQVPVVRGNTPFSVNTENLNKCASLVYERRGLLCVVELKYRTERGAEAKLRVEGPINQNAIDNIFGG